MKNKFRIIAALCVTAILFSSFSLFATAAEPEYDTPVTSYLWGEPDFETDHAYSFAFVGDPQFLTDHDYFYGTNHLEREFKYIANTAEERKLEHVFILGDMSTYSYRNDHNLHTTKYNNFIDEWEIAEDAVFQLSDAGVPFSMVRGNHDDYMIDTYFNVPAYTDQFKGCGGFFSDSDAKYPGKYGTDHFESGNRSGYIYWTQATGHYRNSIVNSWKTVEIHGNKYLFMTIDYNPTDNVLEWVDETLAKFPDHNAIITLHSYLNPNGSLVSGKDSNRIFLGNDANVLWNEVLSKHANVYMVVSGHHGNGTDNPPNLKLNFNYGDNRNKVLQLLVCPQDYDIYTVPNGGYYDSSSNKYVLTNPTKGSGIQNTGLVLYMNFSEDGERISFNYYSTLLNKFLKGNDYTFSLEKPSDNYKGDDPAADDPTGDEPITDQTTADETTIAADSGNNSGCFASLGVASIALIPLTLGATLVATKKKKKDN